MPWASTRRAKASRCAPVAGSGNEVRVERTSAMRSATGSGALSANAVLPDWVGLGPSAAQDREVHVMGRFGRVDAQFGGESFAQPAEFAQRRGGLAQRVERAHELPALRLVERLSG